MFIIPNQFRDVVELIEVKPNIFKLKKKKPLKECRCVSNSVIGHTIRNGRAYVTFLNGGKQLPLARYKAELALNRVLKGKHPVHHLDGNALNDRNNNLVVCESASYHTYIHILMYKRGIKAEKQERRINDPE